MLLAFSIGLGDLFVVVVLESSLSLALLYLKPHPSSVLASLLFVKLCSLAFVRSISIMAPPIDYDEKTDCIIISSSSFCGGGAGREEYIVY